MTSDGRLPDFVIIGAGRSGTTGLHRYLRAHPDVFMPARKELQFFTDHWAEGVGWYRQHFRASTNERAVGEATPAYLYDPDVPHRMASVVPDARLIAILRNPVDRAYSHYWMNRGQKRERLSFEEAIDAEVDRLGTRTGLRRAEAQRRYAYVDRGRYIRQLTRFAEHYPRDQILIAIFEEDLMPHADALYSGVCRFLGVDDAFVRVGAAQAVNAPVAFRSVGVARLASRMPAALRPMAKAVTRANSRTLSYPPMSPEVRARLLDLYTEDNTDLARWLGRDLSVWGS